MFWYDNMIIWLFFFYKLEISFAKGIFLFCEVTSQWSEVQVKKKFLQVPTHNISETCSISVSSSLFYFLKKSAQQELNTTYNYLTISELRILNLEKK